MQAVVVMFDLEDNRSTAKSFGDIGDSRKCVLSCC